MARRRRGPLAKALHDMRPDRVLVRALSLDEAARAVKSVGKPRTRTSAKTRRKQIATGKIPAPGTTKKTAAKKSAAKRDPYADARKIPAANRAVAAKQAKTTQPGAAKKTTAVRKKDGTGRFDGSKVMNERDHANWQRAQAGHVDPALLPRSPRRPRTAAGRARGGF